MPLAGTPATPGPHKIQGIGAGFISWVLIKTVRGKMAEIHWLMWVVSIAFLVFFAQDWINGFIK